MGPAVLVPIGMVAAWGTSVAVASSVCDDSKVPRHRGELVARYKYG